MLWIWNIKKHIVEHNVVDEFRCGEHLPDRAVPSQGIAENGEIDPLAGLDADDIRFRDLRPDRHSVDVRNPQDIRCLLVGVERLPLQKTDGNYFAAHRRRDFGITQIGFTGVYRRRRFLHLRRERGDVGESDIVGGPGDVTVIGGDQLVRKEIVVAIPLQFGKNKLRLFQGAL